MAVSVMHTQTTRPNGREATQDAHLSREGKLKDWVIGAYHTLDNKKELETKKEQKSTKCSVFFSTGNNLFALL